MAELRSRGRGGSRRPVSSAAEWTLRIGLFLFCAFPLYWMLVSSLKVSHELLASPPTFWPHEWDLRAYRKLFYETNFWRYFQNTIVVSAITTFIVAWNDFLFALVLIGRDELKTLAIGINDFFHMAVVDWGLIMAAGVMVTIPALVFFVAIQRYLIAGWGAGGVKG